MVFKERKGGQVKREGLGREKKSKSQGEKGKKNGQPYRSHQPPADTQVLWDFSLGLQRREDWNSALPKSEFEFSIRRRSASSPQLRLRPFDQIPSSGTRAQEKIG